MNEIVALAVIKNALKDRNVAIVHHPRVVHDATPQEHAVMQREKAEREAILLALDAIRSFEAANPGINLDRVYDDHMRHEKAAEARRRGEALLREADELDPKRD